MQWLSLVTEDTGVQRLKADNRKPAVARNVDAVSPYPRTHATRIGEGQAREAIARVDRRGGERREGGDRRKKQVPVILDTRSSNRRGIENRRQTAPRNAADPAPVRINVYA